MKIEKLVTVNYEEGSMPIKYNALFMDKQHPKTQLLQAGLQAPSCCDCRGSVSLSAPFEF